MTVKVEHDIRCVDGAVLYLPPSPPEGLVGIGEPDVYAESATQLYPIGTLLWFPGMGKRYRYSYAGEDLAGTKVLVINANYVPDASSYANDGGFYGHCQEDGVAVAYDAGATVIYVTGTQDTPKNFYQGGHLLHWGAGGGLCNEDSYIISGPDEASTGTWQNQKITLHKAKKYAIVAAQGIEIWRNPYSNIQEHDTTARLYYQTAMGVPPIPINSGYYFWLQTSGPVLVSPNGWGANCPGYAVNTRVAVHNPPGLISIADSTYGLQVVGTLLAATESESADAWVNLNLDLGH